MTAKILYLNTHPGIAAWYQAIADGEPIRTERVYVAGLARQQLIEASYVGEIEALRSMDNNALFLSDVPSNLYDDEKRACQRAADLFAAARMLLLSVAAEGLEIEIPVLLLQRAKLLFNHTFLQDAVAYYQRLEAEVREVMQVSFCEGWKAASQHDLPSPQDIAEREAAFGCRVH